MSYRSRLPLIAAEMHPRVEEAIDRGTEIIAGSARDKVPVDEGDLRDAIHTDEGYVIAGDEDAFYGHMVEHGTSHTSPRPFLIPALEEKRAEVVALVAAALRGL